MAKKKAEDKPVRPCAKRCSCVCPVYRSKAWFYDHTGRHACSKASCGRSW